MFSKKEKKKRRLYADLPANMSQGGLTLLDCDERPTYNGDSSNFPQCLLTFLPKSVFPSKVKSSVSSGERRFQEYKKITR